MVRNRCSPFRFRFRCPSPMALLCVLGAVAGCREVDPEPGAGTLVIPYVLGNDRSCESLGVEYIEAELDEGFMRLEAPCDGDAVRMRNVPAGLYTIEMFGLDENRVPILDSTEGGILSQRVVGDGSTTEVNPPVLLTAAPARLLLRWDFGFGSCVSAGVKQFKIVAWDADEGTEKLMEATMLCETPGEGADQYREVPDVDRELGGDSFGGASISVIDDNGDQVGDVVSFEFEPPGRGREVRLSLTCSESGCDGVVD
ncbi:MAG: hypothetical protein OXU20_20985 [Myxococcales bacterium]|nr:hypothetical protein [Myxococcales bacterium]MDD9970417.1 hypothetical protein [Myxococcales bacterium]